MKKLFFLLISGIMLGQLVNRPIFFCSHHIFAETKQKNYELQ